MDSAAHSQPGQTSDERRAVLDKPLYGSSGADGSRDDARDLKSHQAAGIRGMVGANGASATGVPDGNDDDIVARRLRKAAQLEADPQLKKKLWLEYVEYERNARVP